MNSQQILDYLDQSEFPSLENGYYYHIDQKMDIYLDDQQNWGIILQILAFNNHEYDLNGVKTIVYYYSNLLSINSPFGNETIKCLVKDNGIETFLKDENQFGSYLNPNANSIIANGVKISIEKDPVKYKTNNIELENYPKICPWELMRILALEKSNNFWYRNAKSEQEKLRNLNKVKSIYKWQHPDLFNESPSDMKSFQNIAKFITTKDEKYLTKVEYQSNTHWSYWHMGGQL